MSDTFRNSIDPLKSSSSIPSSKGIMGSSARSDMIRDPAVTAFVSLFMEPNVEIRAKNPVNESPKTGNKLPMSITPLSTSVAP